MKYGLALESGEFVPASELNAPATNTASGAATREIALVGTLALLPAHVQKCIVAYGDARAALASAAAQPATMKQSPHPEYDKGFSDGWNRCESRQTALASAPAQPGRASLSANAAHEIQGMLEEAAALIGSMPEAIFEQLKVRHFLQDELTGGAGIVRDAMAAVPAQPVAEPAEHPDAGFPASAPQPDTAYAAMAAAHVDNAPFGFTDNEKGAWSIGYEAGASRGQAPAGDYMRSIMEGMSVSVDVSTDDATAGHRYFGTVTEVMDAPDDKHGVTLLVQDANPNFQTAQAPSVLEDAARLAMTALRSCSSSGYVDIDGDFVATHRFDKVAVDAAVRAIDAAMAAKKGGE